MVNQKKNDWNGLLLFLAPYLITPIVYIISLLPFWVLYRISDFINFIIFKIIGYRKDIIHTNLKNSFPNKSKSEINEIHKKFNRFFCDLIVETIKTLTISKKTGEKRCSFDDESVKLLDQLHKDHKKIILVLGHQGNWEIAGVGMNSQCKQQLYIIYHPLSNPYLNQLIIKMRTKLGNRLIPMKDVFRKMIGDRKNDEVSAVAFIADQTPPKDNAYWTTFLNQDTPVFWGTEIIASKLNYPVVYISISQAKRGYYNMTAEMLCENPKDTSKGEISEMHTKKLEKDIIKQPEIWLWSHRRWKHKRPAENA
ncbi:MAG: lysophospholipid acyltransferase family protein [Flavobacteriaceae bacterium]|nr:lysophospholipid acyltransferase family protein [Flavobacteriaceae bacterium]